MSTNVTYVLKKGGGSAHMSCMMLWVEACCSLLLSVLGATELSAKLAAGFRLFACTP